MYCKLTNITNSGMILEQNDRNRNIAFRWSIKSLNNAKQSTTLLSHDWKKKSWQDIEFAYYRDLYINNQQNLSNEFIVTTPFRAPQNYYSNGYLICLKLIASSCTWKNKNNQ